MKTSRSSIFSFLLLVSLITVSCNEFLTLTPESEYSVAGGYQTQADFTQAIIGVYDLHQQLYKGAGCWFRGVIARPDDTRANIGYGQGLARFTDDSSTPWVFDTWSQFYRIITLCNLIIDKIDQGEFLNESVRDHIKGEAYHMRAFSYWNLGWHFGGVPLLDRVVTADDLKKIPRSTQTETLDFAADSYLKAIELLPDEWTGGNVGRVTKYGACGMLARLYLFQSKFSEAKPLLQQIMNAGVYGLEAEYRNCFTDSHDNGKERVWETQFTGGRQGGGQAFASAMVPEGFNHPEIMPFDGYAGPVTVSKPHWDNYGPTDVRRDVSILKGYVNRQGQRDTVTMFVRKYLHYADYEPKDKDDWANNIPILRYSDVVLMLAEVLNEEGYIPDGNAFDLLNSVRNRAGLEGLTALDLPDGQSFKEAIIAERELEFAFEGLRWTDIIRWGIAKQAMTALFDTEQEGAGLYKMNDHQVLFAIPYNEIIRYNDPEILWQNDGY